MENRRTRTGQLLRAGDRLDGYVVRSFDTHALVLARRGVRYRLAMNTDYRLTPLDRDAPSPKTQTTAAPAAPSSAAASSALASATALNVAQSQAQAAEETRMAAEALERATEASLQAEEQRRALLEYEAR